MSTDKKVKSSTIIGGTGEYGRSEMDFYQTPKECTVALLDFLHESTFWNFVNKSMTIFEPCCGEGAISSVLRDSGYSVISSDIRETIYAGVGKDYLGSVFSADAIITNPPFNLAEEFIRKALQEAPQVAMLLKSSFWHTKGRLKLFEESKPAAVLPLTWRPAMSPDRGKSPTMDFQWTVWSKYAPAICEYRPLKKPNKTD
jgi:hypothetical protein